MWMEALCKRRALCFQKNTNLYQGRIVDYSNFDYRLQNTKHKEPRYQSCFEEQGVTSTLDTSFCSSCHEYRTRRITNIPQPTLYSCISVTLLIIFSLLTNSSYANAQPPPLTTTVSQRPDPGMPTSSIISLEGEKYKNLENQPQARTIPGAPYYEFFINEASYKFWAVFQLTTVFILLYSAFAAIYYAKYTFLTEIETLKDEDIILRRRRQLNSAAAQQIIKATESLTLPFKYTGDYQTEGTSE